MIIASRFFLRGFLALSLILIVSSSCKKKRAFNEEDAQDTVDNRIIQGEMDEVIKDVNTVIMEQYQLHGRSASESGSPGTTSTSICGALVDTSGMSAGIVTISYDGSNCYGRTRAGSIRFSIMGYPGTKWKNQGCRIKIDYNSYSLTRASDGKGITLEGSSVLVNESGNTWYDLWYLNAPRLVYTFTADDIRVTFNNADFAKYNFNRRMTYTFSNFVTSCSVEGLGSSDGHNNLENWGQARRGEKFTSEVSSPFVWKTSCGSIAPVSGELIMRIDGKEHELKSMFAVDKDGNDVSGTDNPCPFGWKVSWKYKKKTNTRTFSYY